MSQGLGYKLLHGRVLLSSQGFDLPRYRRIELAAYMLARPLPGLAERYG